MRYPHFWANVRPVRSVSLYRPVLMAPFVLGAMSLSGCQSTARQDVFQTPNATCAYMMPTVSGARTYEPRRTEAQNEKKPPNSVVAYPDPETPAYCDRPLADTLPASLELADYTRGLTATALLPLLQQKGPYTVFGIPNSALEHYITPSGQSLFSPEQASTLRQILAYSIVPGHWTLGELQSAVKTSATHSITLPTLNGLALHVSQDTASGQLLIGNGANSSSRLWVNGIPQANGVLYFAQSLVVPPSTTKP